ncbi:MAG TPA: sigma-70 family RNA polymerase sigma factor [Burkholderiaceae bacterium]|nr:sigma-70 family RNA polymerase sigma factor [Burkholderiaceae bacterium]
MTTSADLQHALERVAIGDRDAFKRVYDATSAHLLAIALRLLNRRDLAERALQDTFVAVWQQARSYPSDALPPMAWLVTILRRKALDRSRRQPHAALADHATPPDAADVLDDAIALIGCTEDWRALSVTHRRAFAWALYDGMSAHDIARRLNLPVSTVRAGLRRALAHLKQRLDKTS